MTSGSTTGAIVEHRVVPKLINIDLRPERAPFAWLDRRRD
jgi:hypothetical protein